VIFHDTLILGKLTKSFAFKVESLVLKVLQIDYICKKRKIMNALTHAHSGLRYVVLALMLAAIFKAFTSKQYTEGTRKLNLFAMISVHIQIVIGLILYFTSEKVRFFEETMSSSFYRFFAVEHIFGMLVAMALVTIGHSKAKKATTDVEKFKKIKVFYTLALIIILATIPWPFREALGGKWF
jgi:heme A synthase